MTGTITRTVTREDKPPIVAEGKTYYPTLTTTFFAAPVPVDAAISHVLLNYPKGTVVLSGGRGPKGGWIGLRVVKDPARIERHRGGIHIVVES